MDKLRVIELFAGIGAWSKALENLGINHEVVTAVEFNKYAMQAYNVVHGSSFVTQDITKVDVDELPECDMVCYSPPCQSFSQAGKGLGIEDARGTLFYDALRIIDAKKPKYALMENVKGLTQKNHRDTFENMLKCLEDIGYTNHWKLLNSKDHGVAQNRVRVFIVSIRNDLVATTPFAFPEPYDNGVRLRHILEPVVDEKYYIDDAKCAKLIEELQLVDGRYGVQINRGKAKIKHDDIASCLDANYWKGLDNHASRIGVLENIAIPCLTPDRLVKRQNGRRFKEDGDPAFTVTSMDRHGVLVNNIDCLGLLDIKGNQQIRRVYGIGGISPTLNTMAGGNRQPKVLVEEPRWRIRKLTVLECFRLQAFSDDDHTALISAGISNSQLYRIMGNSITVSVVEGIFKGLLCPTWTQAVSTEVI